MKTNDYTYTVYITHTWNVCHYYKLHQLSYSHNSVIILVFVPHAKMQNSGKWNENFVVKEYGWIIVSGNAN